MKLECHCKRVKIELLAEPETLNRCSCSICRRYGALWAYFDQSNLTITGMTDSYVWGDRMIAFHRCQICGVLTHWTHLDGSKGRIGVNMRNAEQHALLGMADYDGHAPAG